MSVRTQRGDVELLGFWIGSIVLVTAWLYPLWQDSGVGFCPLRTLTGVPCPTCGGTRALVAAVRGEWFEAVGWNPLVGASAIGLLFYVPFAAASVVGDWPRLRPPIPVGRPLRIVLLAVVLANWYAVWLRLG